MKKKIFIITGEDSGDLLAYNIFKNIDLESIDVKGIPGSYLKKLNINGPFENKEITFFGIIDVLKNIFFIKRKIKQTVKFIEEFNPDILFSVDSPDFVFEVIKEIKNRKVIKTKFFHFVAPTIWAWRESRGKKIKKLLDKIYLLFEFEKKYFDKYSIPNKFVGHPFFDSFDFSKSNYNEMSNIISFCPGSRKKEIAIFLPIFLLLIKSLGDKYIYHFAVTKNTEHIVKKKLANLNYQIIVNSNENDKNDYYKKSLFAVAKSGTVGLDLVKAQIPFFIIYKFSWLNYLLIRPFVKVNFANIINIIANKEIIPEFIQSNCNPNIILKKLNYFFTNKKELKKMVNNYNMTLDGFSNKNASKNIAEDLLKNLY